MKLEVAVLGSPSLITVRSGLCGREGNVELERRLSMRTVTGPP